MVNANSAWNEAVRRPELISFSVLCDMTCEIFDSFLWGLTFMALQRLHRLFGRHSRAFLHRHPLGESGAYIRRACFVFLLSWSSSISSSPSSSFLFKP